MDNILSTFLVTFIFICLGMLGLSIGWILKGKGIQRATCGYDPTKKQDDSCSGNQKSCSICSSGSPKKEIEKGKKI